MGLVLREVDNGISNHVYHTLHIESEYLLGLLNALLGIATTSDASWTTL